MKIKVANLVIEIENKFDEVRTFCEKYQVKDEADAVFKVHTTAQENEESKIWYRDRDNIELSDGEAERDQMQHKIYRCLPEFNGFWLHACVVELDGEAYAFSAPSGGGKTTHAKLWLDLFGDRARIINGDNPIIRSTDGTFYAWGTPWCGKEGWNENVGVPLKAICYIKQNDKNYLEMLDPITAYHRLIVCSSQYIRSENQDKTLFLYEQLIEHVPFYQMNCNMDPEAAHVSYEGMSGRKINIERPSETGKVEKK